MNLDQKNPNKAITLACRVLYSIYDISGSSFPIKSRHRPGTQRRFSRLLMRNCSRAGLSNSQLESSGKYFDPPECGRG
jgi:hypothetical protein